MSMAKRIGAANFNLLVIDTENKVRAGALHGVPFCAPVLMLCSMTTLCWQYLRRLLHLRAVCQHWLCRGDREGRERPLLLPAQCAHARSVDAM